jgi:hypothetical protein
MADYPFRELTDEEHQEEIRKRRFEPRTSGILQPDVVNQINRSCELALKGQLNTIKQNMQLKALALKWRTMDAFSKRELGQATKLSGNPGPLPPILGGRK